MFINVIALGTKKEVVINTDQIAYMDIEENHVHGDITMSNGTVFTIKAEEIKEIQRQASKTHIIEIPGGGIVSPLNGMIPGGMRGINISPYPGAGNEQFENNIRKAIKKMIKNYKHEENPTAGAAVKHE